MKILESYTEMMKQFINEVDGKKHKPGDVWKSDRTGNWQAMGPNGDQESFGQDKKAAEKYANPDEKEKDSGEDDAGKLSGKSDFSRDSGDEPKSEPKSEPKDTTGSIAGNEDAIDFAQALAQDLETNRSFQGLKDAGHEDLAKAIYNADSEEEKFDLVRKASEEPDEPESKSSPKKEKLEKEIEQLDDKIQDEVDSMDPDTEYIQKLISKRDKLEDMLDNMDESIKVINGKKYREVKESKESNKHILKENYDRFFGDKKWFHY